MTITAIWKRTAALPKKHCAACKKIQPHQLIDGAWTCWECGEVK